MKVWNENEITIDVLASHLTDSGLNVIASEEDSVWLHTQSGIAFRIAVLDSQKFIRISTYLPLDKERPKEHKLALEHRLNREIFLPVFSLDADDDLTVSYVMPYQQGLIVGQFVSIVNRFTSLLEFLVQSENDDGIIRFDQNQSESNSDTSELNADRPDGVLLN